MRNICVTLLLLLAASRSHALTAADSGWVNIFNGKTFPADSFYVFQSGYVDIAKDTKFKAADSGMIHAGGSYALLVTKKMYHNYRVRVDYRLPSGGNAGLMVLIDNEAAKTDKGVNRPRSIEINCRMGNNYPWSLWAGKDRGPFMSSTIKDGTPDQYLDAKEGGKPFTCKLTADDNRVIRSSYPLVEYEKQWNHGEALMMEATGEFYLNGKLREKAWDFSDMKDTKIKCISGGIGVQTEGADIYYKNWQVMELDATGIPLHHKQEKFTVSRRPSRPVLSLDRGNLDAILREAPTGEGFQWLDVYTSQGRRVTSLKRSASDPARFQWNDAEAGRMSAAGPYLVRWNGDR
jgi:hypothetical protein